MLLFHGSFKILYCRRSPTMPPTPEFTFNVIFLLFICKVVFHFCFYMATCFHSLLDTLYERRLKGIHKTGLLSKEKAAGHLGVFLKTRRGQLGIFDNV